MNSDIRSIDSYILCIIFHKFSSIFYISRNGLQSRHQKQHHSFHFSHIFTKSGYNRRKSSSTSLTPTSYKSNMASDINKFRINVYKHSSLSYIPPIDCISSHPIQYRYRSVRPDIQV